VISYYVAMVVAAAVWFVLGVVPTFFPQTVRRFVGDQLPITGIRIVGILFLVGFAVIVGVTIRIALFPG
jgi:uncharacterized protein YjeT (DUF2065 family)